MNLISIRDMDKGMIEEILSSAHEIKEKGQKVDLAGKILATMFFEPSTRTKLSFQSAAMRCGMEVLDFSPGSSSLKKGETFSDTIQTVEGYADAIAIRHPKEGSARLAADTIAKPVINGGDGGNQHPTQTLIDLFSINEFKGKIKDLQVTLMGDLKHARTMRSLVYGLAMFGAEVTLVSPKGLEMDEGYLEEIREKFGLGLRIFNRPDYGSADVLYVCRIQAERFADPYEAQSVQQKFRVKKSDLKGAKEDLVILHPLPKINEIEPEIDSMPQAKYFEQAHNGIPLRMAVLERILGR